MADLADRFLFEIDGAPELRVARFSGQESLSELFLFEITFGCDESDLDFAPLIGAPAKLTLRGEGESVRHVHGIIARLGMGDSGKRLSLYQATLVPRVATLQQRYDCCIFQELSVPEILQQLFEEAGLGVDEDFRLSLQGSYAKREYCVQYRESDWDFACRLMEEEGIFHFFEHTESGHVLVLGDSASAHSTISGESTLRYRPRLGALGQGEHIERIHYAEALGAGKVTLRDYDFLKPDLLLEGEASAESRTELEVYDYPSALPSAESARAKLRLEARRASERVAEGESACVRLCPGHVFTLSEHSRDALNRGFLLTRVEHQGAQPLRMEGASGEEEERYEGSFAAIPDDVPFRPLPLTPKPSVKGVQSAEVVGPAGEEIHTDEHGRVKVQFHWDRLGKKDDKSSCWIRVSQLFAGAGFGGVFLPRVGQEVLVDFLDGNPDRPIVVGRVYHGKNLPPLGLPDQKTQSTIKTNSTPGGEGFNELRFEDKKESEEVYLRAQKDFSVEVLHDEKRRVDNDESRQVGRDRKVDVKNNETRAIGNDQRLSVGRNQTLEVSQDQTSSIGQNLSISVAKLKNEEVGEDSSESTGKNKSLSVGADYTIEVSGSMSTTVGASESKEVELEKTLSVGEKLVIEVGSAKVTIEKDGKVTIEGSDLALTASGDLKVDASGSVKLVASGQVEVNSSSSVKVNASGSVVVKGSNVGFN